MTQLTDKTHAAVETVRPATVSANANAAAAAPLTPPVVPPPQVAVRLEPRRPGKFRRFVRSVFSHLIFAAIVTAGVFGYVYQDMILGRVATTVCGNDALGPYAAGSNKSAAVAPVSKSPVSVAVAPPPAATSPVVPATPAAAPSTPPAAVIPAPAPKPEIVAATPKSDVAPQPAPPAPAPQVTDAKPAALPAPNVTEPPKPAVSAPAAGTAGAASKPATTALSPSALTSSASTSAAASSKPDAAPVAAPSSPDKLTSAWRAAREAFNAGKPDAIDAYKSLMRSYPDVPDLAGELGNIYYSAGKWREASETYYEAAQRYLKSPQPGYAACLLDVLRNLRSPEAERLAPQITRPCPAARTGQSEQSASNPPRG